MSVLKTSTLFNFLLLVLTVNLWAARPKAPYKVLYSNDTTNVFSCTSPYQPGGYPFTKEALEASIDETVGTGVEVHMLQPGVCWVPWWTSTTLPAPSHYNWFITTYGVYPDSFGSYMRNGGDIVQVFVDRCKLKGISPFISFRLNDGHRLDNVDDAYGQIPSGACNNITEFYRDNPDYRIGTDMSSWYQRVHNWAIPEVRSFKLAYIQEIIAGYDIAGFELDFMRMCSLFNTSTTTSSERQAIIVDVISQVRQYLDDATESGDYKWLCVRVPCYVEAHDALGIDLPAMVEAGVDMVNLSSYFFVDQQAEVAEIVEMIPNTSVYLEMTGTPLTGNPVPGVYDSYDYLRTTKEQFYTTANLAYEQGAAGISMFNFQYYREHGDDIAAPFCEPPFEVFEHLGDPNWLALQNHYYFVGGIWNAPPLDSRPLNQVFDAGQGYTFNMPMGSKIYQDGKLRIRSDSSLQGRSWTVKFNGYTLNSVSDVDELFENPYPNYKGDADDYRAWIVPAEYFQNGDNQVDIQLNSGDRSRIIWIDLMTPKWEPEPELDMDASDAGSNVFDYWQPSVGMGEGQLIGKPGIKAYTDELSEKIWFYDFDSMSEVNDQVLDIGSHSDFDYVDSSACTIEAWVRLPQEIPNSGKRGVIIGNSDPTDTGWRLGLRCDATSGKYSCEFQQRDNETNITPFTGALHYRTASVLEYSSTDWVHIVFVKYPVVYNSGKIEMQAQWFINGVMSLDEIDDIAAVSADDFYYIPLPPQLSTSRNDIYFVGDIGRLRVYNYALDTETIEKLYSYGMSSDVDQQCGKSLAFDVNHDCVFDIIDFEVFANHWLNDNRISTE